MPRLRFQSPVRPLICLTLAGFVGCDSGTASDPTATDAARPPAPDGAGPETDAEPTADAGPDAAPPETGLTVRVQGPDGARPGTLRVFGAVDDGEVFAFDCAGDAPPGVRCTAEGLAFETRPARLELTLKAPGLRTLRGDFAPAASGALDVALTALPAFEQTDDFVTGFAPGATADDLTAMAFEDAGELGAAHVVKWYLEGQGTDAPSVWFMDTLQHPIHYDFVRDVLGRSLSNAEFEQRTYRDAERDAMAGSLIVYPDLSTDTLTAPLTVEFFPTDTLTPEMALEAYLRLEERLPFLTQAPAAGALYYVPAGEAPEAGVRARSRTFALAGVNWRSQRDLYAGIEAQYLNPGVAYGTLRVLTPEQLESEVVSFEDIVVLPRLPNEMPLVGGTISAELQTPLAHVNVAARARNTPNLALVDAPNDPRVSPLVGRLVRFEVRPGGFTLEETTREQAEAYWRDRRDRPPFAPEADLSRAGLISLDDLHFADSNAVGVKAANVAELHHLLGDAAPKGFAVPFAEYHRFMTETPVGAGACADAEMDCLEEARAAEVCAQARGLCEPAEAGAETFDAWIRRAQADAGFTGDSAVREASLDALRWVMRHTDIDATLGDSLNAEVVRIFGEAPVRLRSSTNAEDLDRFTGAGLYDSTTAYGSGGERASKEIRKVWASCWNWRAYEERAFWNVVHDAVQVGVLVQDAFPDEQVNGVLITQNVADPATRGYYVNAQQGETAVTNPTDGALPEIFSIVAGPGGAPEVVRARFSSLSPNASLFTDAEIDALYRTARDVQAHFAPLYDETTATLSLDIEWKLVGPARRLVLKQVRPYSLPDAGR
jgi:hypothetical protein